VLYAMSTLYTTKRIILRSTAFHSQCVSLLPADGVVLNSLYLHNCKLTNEWSL
jgi:hypothetical protein